MSGNQPKSILKSALDKKRIDPDPANSTAAEYQAYLDELIKYFKEKVGTDYSQIKREQPHLIDDATALLNMLGLDEPAGNQKLKENQKKAVQACVEILAQYRASNPSALIDVPPKILEQHPELKAKTLDSYKVSNVFAKETKIEYVPALKRYFSKEQSTSYLELEKEQPHLVQHALNLMILIPPPFGEEQDAKNRETCISVVSGFLNAAPALWKMEKRSGKQDEILENLEAISKLPDSEPYQELKSRATDLKALFEASNATYNSEDSEDSQGPLNKFRHKTIVNYLTAKQNLQNPDANQENIANDYLDELDQFLRTPGINLSTPEVPQLLTFLDELKSKDELDRSIPNYANVAEKIKAIEARCAELAEIAAAPLVTNTSQTTPAFINKGMAASLAAAFPLPERQPNPPASVSEKPASPVENEDKEVDEAFAFLDKDYPEEPLEAEPAAIAVSEVPPLPSFNKHNEPADFLSQEITFLGTPKGPLSELLLAGNQDAWDVLINTSLEDIAPENLKGKKGAGLNLEQGEKTRRQWLFDVFKALQKLGTMKVPAINLTQFITQIIQTTAKESPDRFLRDSVKPSGLIFLLFTLDTLISQQQNGQHTPGNLPILQNLYDAMANHFIMQRVKNRPENAGKILTTQELESAKKTLTPEEKQIVKNDIDNSLGFNCYNALAQAGLISEKVDLAPFEITDFEGNKRKMDLARNPLSDIKKPSSAEEIAARTMKINSMKGKINPFLSSVFLSKSAATQTITAFIDSIVDALAYFDQSKKTKYILKEMQKLLTICNNKSTTPQSILDILLPAMQNKKSTLYTAIHSNRFFHKKTDRAIETTMNTILANQLKLMPASAATAKTPPPRAAGAGTSPLGIGSSTKKATIAAAAEADKSPPTVGG